MKKAGVILVSVVALLILGLPPVLGMLTQSQVEQRAAALGRSGYWIVRVASFERGWFGSRARIELGLSPEYAAQLAANGQLPDSAAAAAARDEGALILVDFAHGPVAALDGLHFGLSKMVARLDPEQPRVAALVEQLGIPYVFEFRGRTGFSGVLAFDADVPPIDAPLPDGVRASFSGAALAGTLAGRALRAQGSIDSVTFESPTGTLGVEDIRASADYEFLSEYVPTGSSELTVDRVTVVEGPGATGPSLEAANLRVTSSASVDRESGLAEVGIQYSAATVTAADMRLADAELRFVVRNLDVAAMQAYVETIQRQGPALASDPAALAAVLTPAIERGLAAGPVLSIEPLRFKLDDQPFDATVTVATETAALPPAGALDLTDPTLWLQIARIDAQLTVAKPLAEQLVGLALQTQLAADDSMPPDQQAYMAQAQAGLMLLTLVTQNVLVDQGESYAAQLTVVNGVPTLNDTVLPFGLR